MVNFCSNNQCSLFVDHLQGNFYKRVHKASIDQPSLVRLAAVPIAFARSLATVTSRISRVGESVLKGLSNIFGGLFFTQCSVSKGVSQLCIDVPKHLIILPFSIVASAFGCLFDACRLTADPVAHSANLWHAYDPHGHDCEKFNLASKALEKDPDNPTAKRELANCYARGIGTEQNFQKACELFTPENHDGDTESLWFFAQELIKQNNAITAMPYLEKAANIGHVKSMVKAAEIYYNSKMYVKALNFYLKAAEAGHLDSMLEYVVLRVEVKKRGIAFDEANGHPPQKASDFLLEAIERGSAGAVAVSNFLIFLKCVSDPEHPQQWSGHLLEETRKEILSTNTPEMMRALKKGIEARQMDFYAPLLLRLCSNEVREDPLAKATVQSVNLFVYHQKLQQDLARQEILMNAAYQTNHPVAMALSTVL